MSAKPKHVKPKAELAALAGVSETTWKKHKLEGCPVPKTARGINAWLKRYHLWRKQNGKFETGGTGQSAELREAKEEAQVLKTKLLRMDYRRRSGELIERATVVEFCGKAVLSVRQRLEAIRHKMAARLENVTADVVDEELQREFDALCDDFTRGLNQSHDDGSASA